MEVEGGIGEINGNGEKRNNNKKERKCVAEPQRTVVTGCSWKIIFSMRSNLKHDFILKYSIILCRIQKHLQDKAGHFKAISH